jgi:hypothetical protein
MGGVAGRPRANLENPPPGMGQTPGGSVIDSGFRRRYNHIVSEVAGMKNILISLLMLCVVGIAVLGSSPHLLKLFSPLSPNYSGQPSANTSVEDPTDDQAPHRIGYGTLPKLEPTPPPTFLHVDPEQSEVCADSPLLYTTLPPKCISNKGRLMFMGGSTHQVMPVTK